MMQAGAELAAAAVFFAAIGGLLLGYGWKSRGAALNVGGCVLLAASLFLLYCALFTE